MRGALPLILMSLFTSFLAKAAPGGTNIVSKENPASALRTDPDTRTTAPIGDIINVYAELTGKTVLMAPGLPVPALSNFSELPSETKSATTVIEQEFSKAGIHVISDGPHFVRLMREDQQKTQSGPPLRGIELAASKHGEVMHRGYINFPAVMSDDVLRVYAELAQRTVLRPAVLPGGIVRLRTTCALTREETAYALATVLTLNNLAIVEDGENFLQVVPSFQRERANTHAPKRDKRENLFDPKKLPSMGSLAEQGPGTKWDRDFDRVRKAFYKYIHHPEPRKRSLQQLLELYADLIDKKAEGVPSSLEWLPVTFHIVAPLTKSELLYAIQTTFSLNNLALVSVDANTIRLRPTPDFPSLGPFRPTPERLTPNPSTKQPLAPR